MSVKVSKPRKPRPQVFRSLGGYPWRVASFSVSSITGRVHLNIGVQTLVCDIRAIRLLHAWTGRFIEWHEGRPEAKK